MIVRALGLFRSFLGTPSGRSKRQRTFTSSHNRGACGTWRLFPKVQQPTIRGFWLQQTPFMELRIENRTLSVHVPKKKNIYPKSLHRDPADPMFGCFGPAGIHIEHNDPQLRFGFRNQVVQRPITPQSMTMGFRHNNHVYHDLWDLIPLCIYVYGCICGCVHIRIFSRHVYIYICVPYIYTSVYIYIYIYAYILKYVYVYIYIYVQMHVYIRMHRYICIYRRICMCVNTLYTYIYIYICISIHRYLLRTYVYVYVRTHPPCARW